MKDRVIAFIPARKGSKEILDKNIKKIKGKSLIEYAVKSALNIKKINQVFISTDDQKYAKIAIKSGAEILSLRKKKLSSDSATTYDVLKNFLKEYKKKYKNLPKIVITLQPTSPLRKKYHIERALNIFLKDRNADSLVSCTEVPHNFYPYSVFKIDKKSKVVKLYLGKSFKPKLRQKKNKLFARNGAIYITKIDKKNNFIFGGKQLSYEMKFSESIDINGYDDLFIAKKLI